MTTSEAPVSGMTVLDLVREQVQTRPNGVAVMDADRELTYAELWNVSTQVARSLLDKGIGRGDVVGLCVNRSVDVVVGILGTLRAGAAYVPLDADYPASLLRSMVESTGIRAVTGHRQLIDKLPDVERLGRVHLEELNPGDLGIETGQAVPEATPLDLCYVLYTSGTTGTPKGIAHAHASLANLIRWQLRDSACGPGHRTALFAPTSFDVSFQEIFATLGAGGTLVCVGDDERIDPDLLWQFILGRGIHRIFLPPVALQLLAGLAEPSTVAGTKLIEVITAGETLQCSEDVRVLFTMLPRCRLINQYGPTETHVVTRYVLPERPETWQKLPPIGTPIDGVRLHLVGSDDQPLPEGEVGELGISGVALARGYWNNSDLTAQRFVAELGAVDERMYLTGDLCTRNHQGEIEFVGRNDEQVKVQGYRVELAHVEIALLDLPGVRACATVAVKHGGLSRVLVAHVVPAEDVLTETALRRALRERLPEYMVPSRIRFVTSLPRTPNGKVDRKAVTNSEESAWNRS